MKSLGYTGGHYYLYRSILSILSGILLIAFPEKALVYVVYIIGAITLLFGLSTFFGKRNQPRSEENANKPFSHRDIMKVNGGINIVLGLFLIIAPTVFIDFLIIIIGIYIVLAGIFQIYLLMQRKKIEGQGVSATLYILPAIIAICGLVIILYPFQVVANLVLMTGVVIVFYGVVELVVRVRLKSLMR